MTNEITVHQPASHSLSAFSDEHSFAVAQRMVKALTSSGLVPTNYRGNENIGNALIALDMANRMQIAPITVMQNLHIIEGRPSWSSSFIIGALGSCGLFSPIRWKVEDLGEVDVSYDVWEGAAGQRRKRSVTTRIADKSYTAYAIEKATGEVLEGPAVTLSMAIAEGWYQKNGSKWKTMPDLMGRYRSAAFFGRLYAPHIMNGMPLADETMDTMIEDVTYTEAPMQRKKKPINEILQPATTPDEDIKEAADASFKEVTPDDVINVEKSNEPDRKDTLANSDNASDAVPDNNSIDSADKVDIPMPTDDDLF